MNGHKLASAVRSRKHSFARRGAHRRTTGISMKRDDPAQISGQKNAGDSGQERLLQSVRLGVGVRIWEVVQEDAARLLTEKVGELPAPISPAS